MYFLFDKEIHMLVLGLLKDFNFIKMTVPVYLTTDPKSCGFSKLDPFIKKFCVPSSPKYYYLRRGDVKHIVQGFTNIFILFIKYKKSSNVNILY